MSTQVELIEVNQNKNRTSLTSNTAQYRSVQPLVTPLSEELSLENEIKEEEDEIYDYYNIPDHLDKAKSKELTKLSENLVADEETKCNTLDQGLVEEDTNQAKIPFSFSVSHENHYSSTKKALEEHSLPQEESSNVTVQDLLLKIKAISDLVILLLFS